MINYKYINITYRKGDKMIDYRLNTFLDLCNTLNYTKTAERLHITQPAVTQHIKYLEEYYNNKLFLYKNRKLLLTEAGKKLYDYIISLKINSEKVRENLFYGKFSNEFINFGATLTIGEYIMPDIIIELKKVNPSLELSLRVANTENLLKFLHEGTIDFAIIEGHFNKNDYEHFLFSKERFIGVKKKSDFKKLYKLEELYSETLIVRERGSGTREILDHILYEKNMNLDNFKEIMQIGNINAIKKLVKSGLGITFLYEKAIEKEIKEGIIEEINIENFQIEREFNFIFLKNSYHFEEYKKWFENLANINEINKDIRVI